MGRISGQNRRYSANLVNKLILSGFHHWGVVETNSTWNVEGKCLTGPLAGQQLDHVSYTFLRFHGWAWAHRENDIYQSAAQPKVEEGVFKNFLKTAHKGL